MSEELSMKVSTVNLKEFFRSSSVFQWNCRYEFEMQYGSIGWSVGATLGYSQALKGIKRVIACIGDGSFQVCVHLSHPFM